MSSVSAVPAEVSPRTGFLSHPGPVRLILASFFVLTIPLCLSVGADTAWPLRWSLGSVYVCALGTTHFLISFAVYFQAENLRYFNRDWVNRGTFFLLPGLVFVSFDLYHALGVAVAWPLFDIVFRSTVRVADFHHFTRQTFGVLQLFRARSGCQFPGWLSGAESYFFNALALLLFITFLGGGRFRSDRIEGPLVLSAVVVLGVVIAAGYVRAWRGAAPGSRAGLPAVLGYLSLQTAAASLAAFRTSLYAFSLATHYVEYHVLMAPRCFSVPLDPAHRVDRLWARVRAHRFVFYAALLIVAVPVTRYAWMGMWQVVREGEAVSPLSYRLLIAAFDGLFVVHYLIESRIWRFSEPFFRARLRALYLAPSPTGAVAVISHAPPDRSSFARLPGGEHLG